MPEPSSAASEKAPENPLYRAQGLAGLQGQPMSNPMEYLFQSQDGADGFDPGATAMQPGVYEAMSSLEPLSAWVGTIPEFDQTGPR